jgi:hypothetical protein
VLHPTGGAVRGRLRNRRRSSDLGGHRAGCEGRPEGTCCGSMPGGTGDRGTGPGEPCGATR